MAIPAMPAMDEGEARALATLRRAIGPLGFTAATLDDAVREGQPATDGAVRTSNYARTWARDGVICGLAGLLSDDGRLGEAFARTLETLRAHQGPHGEIPSNVAPDGAVSYGSLAGRADAPLWYVVGCAVLGARDAALLARHAEAMRRALWLAGAWEYNLRGLIYAPLGGSWADEYPLHGYVLHVQALYLWALQAAGTVLADEALLGKARALRELVRANYWLDATPGPRYAPHAYGEALRAYGPSRYWLAAFHPGGYAPFFDGLGDALALLTGLGHAPEVAAYLEALAGERGDYLTPAFAPVITPDDSHWAELTRYHAYAFRNQPWEYHNGGRWPMVTGFMAAGLATSGEGALARRLARAIDAANARDNWGFYEFAHGRTGQPGGVRETAWSAAGAILAHAATGSAGATLAATLLAR